jgi:hypothetical protein
MILALFVIVVYGYTYGSILGSLRATALDCEPVALVLETLRSNQTLDLGSLGVGLRALLLGDDLTADDELADLNLHSSALDKSDKTTTLRLNPLHNRELAETQSEDWRSTQSAVKAGLAKKL